MVNELRFLLRVLAHVLLLRPLLHLIFGLNVRGRENLPERGPFILAANHNSHLDILMLFASLPVTRLARTHAVAAKDYFAPHKVLFLLVNYLFRPIWVDRQARGSDPVGEMSACLDAGENIVIFPEGTRGEAGQVGVFYSGVGQLMIRHREVPLLPVFLLGSERALPRKSAVPLPMWHQVNIGPPLVLTDATMQDDSAQVDDKMITVALRDSILSIGHSQTAQRHRRRSGKRETLVVAVLGIDGSGKSTLSRHLARHFSTTAQQDGSTGSCLIGDQLELFVDCRSRPVQPLLKEKFRRWISAQAKEAKSLARYKIPKLTELLLRDALTGEARRWYGAGLIVLDGSPLLNMTAWSVLYRPELLDEKFCALAVGALSGKRKAGPEDAALYREFPELRTIKRLGLKRLRLPDVVFFLDVDPVVAMERISSRGETMQVHETEQKLQKLQQAYRLVVQTCGRQFGLPAFTIDGHGTVDSIVSRTSELLEQVLSERRNSESGIKP